MKIGIITSMAGFGGTENVSSRISILLASRGHNVYLISGHGPLVDQTTKNGVKHLNLDFYVNGIFGYIKSTISLSKILIDNKIEILHCQMARPVIACFVANLISGKKAKVIWHSRGLKAETYPKICRLFNFLNIFAIGNCKHESEKIIKHGYKREKTAFTYNPLPINNKKNIKHPGNEVFTLGSLSRLAPDRMVNEAILILNELHKAGVEAKLIIAGDGPERENLELLVRDLKLNSAVEFVGSISFLPDFFSRISVLVNPIILHGDNGAGVGNNILEAAQAAIPVVSYDCCGISEIVINEQTGYSIPIGRRDIFIKRLSSLARNEEIRQRLGAALHDHVNKLCNDAAIYNTTMLAYRASGVYGSVE